MVGLEPDLRGLVAVDGSFDMRAAAIAQISSSEGSVVLMEAGLGAGVEARREVEFERAAGQAPAWILSR